MMNSLHRVEDPMSKAEVECELGEVQRDWVSRREVGFMSVSARRAPREESLMLVARPMPPPAPVMRMTLFSKGYAIMA